MSTLFSDIKHGVRVLLSTPMFSISTVLVLALGIGATTAVFGVINALLFAPLPYANADRLVMVWEHNVTRNAARNVINGGNFYAWQERSRSFDELAIFTPMTLNLTGRGDPEELRSMATSVNLLRFLGAQPIVGRLFAVGEDTPGATRPVILSEGFWRRHFGGDNDALGQTLVLSGSSYVVIGVLPATFELLGQRADVWRPLVLDASERGFSGRAYLSIGLLKAGVTRDHAQHEMEAIAAGLAREQPEFDAGWTVNLVPLREQLTADARPALLTLFVAAAAVLLIACANLVSLLLARAAARHHELAVRAALGAGASRLVRQLLTETTLLVLTGGVLGVAVAAALQSLFVRTATAQSPLPLLGQIRVDSVVVSFAVLATGITALSCGLWPALAVRRPSLTSTLREGGRGISGGGHGRLRALLVAAEVAAAVILLAGAGLLIRSFVALQQVDPGFNPSHVLALRVIRPATPGTPEMIARSAAINEEAVERLRQISGVQAAAGTVFLPLAGMGSATTFWLEDRPHPEPANRPVAEIRPVTSGYFQAIGIPLLVGRDISNSDRADRPLVAVVNETFVRTFFVGDNPLGKRLTYSWDGDITVEIAGVVGDARLTSLDGQVRPTLYLPNRQRPMVFMNYVVRTIGEPASIAAAAVAVLREIDPSQPILIRTLEEVVARSISRPRLTSTAVASFAMIALLLAIIGVYGVVAYGVSQRLPEFGVRLALGARPADILRLVLRQGMIIVGIGVAVGIAVTIPLSRVLRSQLFGVEPGDPVTLTGTAVILIIVAAIACYLPARRGAIVDPMQTLRAQ
jgi:putative ABC transport system permease protein